MSLKEVFLKVHMFSLSFTGFASTYIGRIIKSITSSFNTDFDLEQVGKLSKVL